MAEIDLSKALTLKNEVVADYDAKVDCLLAYPKVGNWSLLPCTKFDSLLLEYCKLMMGVMYDLYLGRLSEVLWS